jgi:hypothetical protein
MLRGGVRWAQMGGGCGSLQEELQGSGLTRGERRQRLLLLSPADVWLRGLLRHNHFEACLCCAAVRCCCRRMLRGPVSIAAPRPELQLHP